jgi:hypothetical protein
MEYATFNPVVTHIVVGTAREYALSLLPAELIALEEPTILHLDMDAADVNNPALTAHRDYRACAINAYLEANGETTHYYEWDQKAKSLHEVSTFKARAGEWWLLDTNILHSVSLIPKKRRVVISISFNVTPFKKVKQLIGGLE